MSADELAAAAGLERTAIYRIEAKDAPDPRLSTVIAIANALSISLDELAGLKTPAKGKRDPKSRKAAALLREAAALLED